jgi:hypothetical protein
LRRPVPSFTVEIRRRPGLATTLSPRAPSSATRSPQAEFGRESHRTPVGFVAKEAASPVEVASAPKGRILPSLVCDEPLRRTLRDAAPTPAESAPSSLTPKRPSQRKDQATKLLQSSSVSPHESQQVVEEKLTASRLMSRVQSDEGAGASPRAQTRAPSQVGGDSRALTLGAKTKRFDKIAISRDDLSAKPLPDDQESTARTDPRALLSSRVDGRSPGSRKRTIMARYVFGDELKPGERWKRRLLTSR